MTNLLQLRETVADWLNAFKADPFSTGADKVDRLFEVTGIERLLKREETLREALESFVPFYESWMDEWPDDAQMSVFRLGTYGQLRKARALTNTHPDKQGA